MHAKVVLNKQNLALLSVPLSFYLFLPNRCTSLNISKVLNYKTFFSTALSLFTQCQSNFVHFTTRIEQAWINSAAELFTKKRIFEVTILPPE